MTTLNHFENKNIITALIIVGIVLLVSLIVWVNIDISDKVKESENTLTVSATGEVYAKPDLALTTFSVVTEAKTVAQAMTENTQKMNAVIDIMKEQGIEEKDLKTLNFNIYPRYEWDEEGRNRTLVGYEVYQSLQVKIRQLEKIGAIVQGATEAGANQVSDLQFTIDNQDELKKQAREKAIEEAKTKAKDLAGQLGVKLVGIANFSESAVLPYYYGLEKSLGFGGEESAPQIETGENKIEVTVAITYAIK